MPLEILQFRLKLNSLYDLGQQPAIPKASFISPKSPFYNVTFSSMTSKTLALVSCHFETRRSEGSIVHLKVHIGGKKKRQSYPTGRRKRALGEQERKQREGGKGRRGSFSVLLLKRQWPFPHHFCSFAFLFRSPIIQHPTAV